MKGQAEIDEVLEGIAQIRLLSRVITEMEMDQDSLGTVSIMMYQTSERMFAAHQAIENTLCDLQLPQKEGASVKTETPVLLVKNG